MASLKRINIDPEPLVLKVNYHNKMSMFPSRLNMEALGLMNNPKSNPTAQQNRAQKVVPCMVNNCLQLPLTRPLISSTVDKRSQRAVLQRPNGPNNSKNNNKKLQLTGIENNR